MIVNETGGEAEAGKSKEAFWWATKRNRPPISEARRRWNLFVLLAWTVAGCVLNEQLFGEAGRDWLFWMGVLGAPLLFLSQFLKGWRHGLGLIPTLMVLPMYGMAIFITLAAAAHYILGPRITLPVSTYARPRPAETQVEDHRQFGVLFPDIGQARQWAADDPGMEALRQIRRTLVKAPEATPEVSPADMEAIRRTEPRLDEILNFLASHEPVPEALPSLLGLEPGEAWHPVLEVETVRIRVQILRGEQVPAEHGYERLWQVSEHLTRWVYAYEDSIAALSAMHSAIRLGEVHPELLAGRDAALLASVQQIRGQFRGLANRVAKGELERFTATLNDEPGLRVKAREFLNRDTPAGRMNFYSGVSNRMTGWPLLDRPITLSGQAQQWQSALATFDLPITQAESALERPEFVPTLMNLTGFACNRLTLYRPLNFAHEYRRTESMLAAFEYQLQWRIGHAVTVILADPLTFEPFVTGIFAEATGVNYLVVAGGSSGTDPHRLTQRDRAKLKAAQLEGNFRYVLEMTRP